MNSTLATCLSVAIKHALMHLRAGKPNLAEVILNDAQATIDRANDMQRERDKARAA